MTTNLNDSIDCLELEKDLKKRLEDNNIIYVKDLWQMKRQELKVLGFNNKDINEVIIKLQLSGLDLNRKYVK